MESESTAEKRYHSILDNYCLSIPPTPSETWRNKLQILYDTMKNSISEPLGIGAHWFDMHELSEEHDSRFGMSDAEVILGVRKIAYASFLPEWLRCYETFFTLAWSFSPEKSSLEERSSLSRKIVDNYKMLIDKTRKAREEVPEGTSVHGWESILSHISKEFGARAHIESRLRMHSTELDCFSYPRCSGGCGGPTKDYAAALGDSYLFQAATEDVIREKDPLIFIPADDPFYEDTYPGFLSSYQALLRFFQEVYEKIDLIRAREKKMLSLIGTSQ